MVYKKHCKEFKIRFCSIQCALSLVSPCNMWVKPLVNEAPYIVLFVHYVVKLTQTCLMACLFCLLAKPVHNLDLRVFQRYFIKLCQALSSCLDEVTLVLYKNELVTREERNQVEKLLGLTKFEKAAILVEVVERRIVAENSSAPLKKFSQTFRKHHSLGGIMSRMKALLGECLMQTYIG